jgi:hypothetical protein
LFGFGRPCKTYLALCLGVGVTVGARCALPEARLVAGIAVAVL